MSEPVVQIDVGTDAFRAQAIVDILAEEGIPADFVMANDQYIGLEFTTPHKVTLRERDLDRALGVIDDHFGELVHEPSPRTPVSRRTRIVTIVILGAMFGSPIVAEVVDRLF